MSKMTFDDLMQLLLEDRDKLTDPNSNVDSLELIMEVLNTGAEILNKYPHERIAGMISLIQTSTTIAALENGEMMAALLSENDEFQTALMYAVQACVGLMTMEEVR